MLTGGGVTLSHADAVRFAKSVAEYEEYFLALIRERARRPGDDLLSTLLGADSHGGTLGHERVAANVMFLVGAGHMTTTHLIANSVVACETAQRIPNACDEKSVRQRGPVAADIGGVASSLTSMPLPNRARCDAIDQGGRQ